MKSLCQRIVVLELKYANSRLSFTKILATILLAAFICEARSEILPQSDDRYLVVEDILGFDRSKIRIARNEIFARRGYIFNSADLRNHFSKFSWYQPSTKNVTLSKLEKFNVGFLKKFETNDALFATLTVRENSQHSKTAKAKNIDSEIKPNPYTYEVIEEFVAVTFLEEKPDDVRQSYEYFQLALILNAIDKVSHNCGRPENKQISKHIGLAIEKFASWADQDPGYLRTSRQEAGLRYLNAINKSCVLATRNGTVLTKLIRSRIDAERYAARVAKREKQERESAGRRQKLFQETINKHLEEGAAEAELLRQAKIIEDKAKSANIKSKHSLLDKQFTIYSPYRVLKKLKGSGYHPELLKCRSDTTPLKALTLNLEEASTILNSRLYVKKERSEITYLLVSRDSDLFVMSVYSGRSCSDRGHIFTSFPYFMFGITRGFEGAENFIADSDFTLIYDGQTGIYDEEFTTNFAANLPGTRY